MAIDRFQWCVETVRNAFKTQRKQVFFWFLSVIAAHLVGTLITVGIVDRWYAAREEERLRARLVLEVATGTNDIANSAIIRLRHEGWLGGENGALKGKNLDGANLKGAAFQGANLEGTSLQWADLRDALLQNTNLKDAVLFHTDMRSAILDDAVLRNANLLLANLQFASLIGADLRNTNLSGVNFEQAELMEANLQEALLDRTNLRGALMMEANLNHAHLYAADLRGAILGGAQVAEIRPNRYASETLYLPDGRHWDTETDWTRFTDVWHRESDSTWQRVERERKRLGLSDY